MVFQMNRIFNHKYNHNGDIVVVSELAIKNAKKRKVICLAILSFFPLVVLASDVGIKHTVIFRKTKVNLFQVQQTYHYIIKMTPLNKFWIKPP